MEGSACEGRDFGPGVIRMVGPYFFFVSMFTHKAKKKIDQVEASLLLLLKTLFACYFCLDWEKTT